jgi:hypothetical protein
MQTDQLIHDLALDLVAAPRARSVRPLAVRLLVAILLAAVPVLLVIVFGLSLASHLEHGLGPAIEFTFAGALVLAAGAFLTAVTLGRPDGNVRTGWLVLPPLILLVGIAAELAAWPRATWQERLVGEDPLTCFVIVSVLSLPMLAAALFALRDGAPTRPRLAGAMAGLLAGAISAALYMLHCPEDSLLFVVAWHVPAIALVAAVGAAVAGRMLRW